MSDKILSTDLQIRNLKPDEKDAWYSLVNGKGLRLLLKPNGQKYWRLKYRFGGKQKTLALGVYPDISMKDARRLVYEAKSLIQEGIDPSLERKAKKRQNILNAGNLFESIAEEWWQHQKGTWTDDHANRVWLRLKDNTFHTLGSRVITELTPQDVIAVIRKIEQRGALDVAQRVLQDIRRVCRYAVQTGRLASNPISEVTAEVLKARSSEHRPSLPREQLPDFLKLLDTYHEQGRLLTQLAIELLILTFVRPGELRGARWQEFDFEEKLWRIPGERMKMGTDHIVPLSFQSIQTLEKIRPITEHYGLVFPSERRRTDCMSDNTMRRAIFKLGYDGNAPGKSKCVPHGFRATASSILNETGFNPDAIERQLSHMERDGVRAAYTHHARYLDERREMMQWWASYLEELKVSGKVIPIFAKQN